MNRVELALEKVKRLDETQAEALLEWLELRENREALRQQLKQGEKIPGTQVHAEIRKRSLERDIAALLK